MARYALAHHVFVCVQDEHVVFLDVRRDRYFALEAAGTRGLGSLVRGWPAKDGESCSVATAANVADLLAKRGLLTAGAGKEAIPTQHLPAVDEIWADGAGEPPQITMPIVLRFASAVLGASLALRFARLEDLVHGMRRRRGLRRHTHSDVAGDPSERAALLPHLVSAFSWLRPYFFNAKDACLFEALALSRFLGAYRFYPHWVFGVQARPFAAHCWLQQDQVVLNDTVEYVSQYTPIMVV